MDRERQREEGRETDRDRDRDIPTGQDDATSDVIVVTSGAAALTSSLASFSAAAVSWETPPTVSATWVEWVRSSTGTVFSDPVL